MYLKAVMEMRIPEDERTCIVTDVTVQKKRSRLGFCLQYTDYRIGNNTLQQQNDVTLVSW